MDSFEIIPGSLESASAGLNRSADDHAVAVQQLQSRILGAGSPWGSDEIGSMFGPVYEEVSQLGIQALTTLTEGMRGTAEGLAAMARTTQQTDQDEASAYQSLETSL